ncbi:MAG: EpsD family peptidyl-prolyl cis-trans isomerase [Duganella sp.]
MSSIRKAGHPARRPGAQHRRSAYVCALLVAATLAACGGKKDAPSGQALVRVGSEEITAMQLNEELQRANVPAAQQEAGRKQLLQSLVERQLLVNAAQEEKLDRDPKVVQAVERAKALILAQSYMQKRLPTGRPTAEEVSAYYNKHPLFFSARKQFELRQLVVATKDLDAESGKAIEAAKSIDEVAVWFDQRGTKYQRAQVSRTSADLPEALSERLIAMKPGQLFILREGERSVLSVLADTRPAPVDLATATPQIEQFLVNARNKEAATAELARLRAAGKVEYLNKSLAPDAAAPAAAAPAAPAAPAATEGHDVNARGVSGLK